MTRYSVSILSFYISILSFSDRYCHRKVIFISILSSCHFVDRMTIPHIVTLQPLRRLGRRGGGAETGSLLFVPVTNFEVIIMLLLGYMRCSLFRLQRRKGSSQGAAAGDPKA